ncbi:hypothetical protein Esti_000698 [Eimeria stiedai]
MSFSKTIRPGAPPFGALREVHRWGRRTGAHKISLLSQTYEKPTLRRNRIAGERAYYAKWFFLKYATEVVKHAIKNHLLLPAPVDCLDEQRLTSLRFKGFFNYEEAREKLRKVEEKLKAAEVALQAMELFNPLTGERRASSSNSSPVVFRLLSEVSRKKGFLPSLSNLLKHHLERRAWTSEEAIVLRIQLKEWRNLVLEKQQLSDLLEAADGKAAAWASGFSQVDLEALSRQHNSSSFSIKNKQAKNGL